VYAGVADNILQLYHAFETSREARAQAVRPRSHKRHVDSNSYARLIAHTHRDLTHTFIDVDQEEDERPNNIIISYAAFAKLHATEFPHLLPGSKRLCPVCEDLKFHQGHLFAEQRTEELRVFQQHKSAIEQERAFEAALRSEARQSLDKVRVCVCAPHSSCMRTLPTNQPSN